VADALGVSASLISQVELGKTQPSVSTLWALVTHLGISIDDLLDTTPPRSTVGDHGPLSQGGAPETPVLQRGEDNLVLEMENGVRWERIAHGEGGPADGILVTYEPGATSSVEGRLMRHAGVEYAYLMEGELTLQLDFDTFVMRAGDSVHFDPVRPHLYSNLGSVPARGLWFVFGRRQQNQAMPAPSQPSGRKNSTSITSAVDVLQRMDEL
jgi:quercetin dioxygenase-like cupin family protein